MKREIYFLDHPDAHVAFRDAAIFQLKATPKGALALWEEELKGAVAAYSRGDDLEKVKARFNRAVDAILLAGLNGEKIDPGNRDQYHLLLWTLSLALVMGLETEKMNAFVASLNLKGKDALLDCLLKLVDPALEPVTTFLHDGPFHYLTEASQLPGEAGGPKVQSYLMAYLPELDNLSWYGSHVKQEDKFFGYWAFEVAAVVKAFHITDRLFADHIFYPRDLVHQRMFRTWMDALQGEKDREEMESALDDEETQAALEELADMFRQHYGGDGKEIPDALNLLATISGQSNEDLQEDPEKMMAVMRQIFKGVIQANDQLQGVLQGQELSAEAAAFIKDLKLDELEGPELDREALEKEIGDEKSPNEQIGEHYAKISAHLAEVLEKEKEGEVAFMQGLEMLMIAYGSAVSGNAERIKKEVSAKVYADLTERRKGKDLSDFDWASLFPKKEGESGEESGPT